MGEWGEVMADLNGSQDPVGVVVKYTAAEEGQGRQLPLATGAGVAGDPS